MKKLLPLLFLVGFVLVGCEQPASSPDKNAQELEMLNKMIGKSITITNIISEDGVESAPLYIKNLDSLSVFSDGSQVIYADGRPLEGSIYSTFRVFWSTDKSQYVITHVYYSDAWGSSSIRFFFDSVDSSAGTAELNKFKREYIDAENVYTTTDTNYTCSILIAPEN